MEASKICSRVDINYTEIISFVRITALTRAFAPFLSSPFELLVKVHVSSGIVKLLMLALTLLTLLNLFNAHLLFH